MKKFTVHHIHNVLKGLSCHKAILLITWQLLDMCVTFVFPLRDLGGLCGVVVFVYVDVNVYVTYKYLCPMSFLRPRNQEDTLLLMITYVLYPLCL